MHLKQMLVEPYTPVIIIKRQVRLAINSSTLVYTLTLVDGGSSKNPTIVKNGDGTETADSAVS